MARLKKLVNQNYIGEVQAKALPVNEKNRSYIDRFVTINYQRLSDKFRKLGNAINSNALDSVDKLDEVILSLYTDQELDFKSQEQANEYLSSKFTEKTIRVVVKKPVKDCVECEDSEEDIIQI